MPPGPLEVLTGRLTMTRRGFGFVAVERDARPDIFVGRRALGDALHGDLVAVETREASTGRTGRIVGVIERGISRVLGIVRSTGRNESWLEPDDERLGSKILLHGEVPRAAREQQVVGVEITAYKSQPAPALEGRFVRSFGRRGVAAAEIDALCWREKVEEAFPQTALLEVGQLATAADSASREDLCGLDLVTIDPEDARDHDDALFAEPARDGELRIVVAISDVSAYVASGSALDNEAMRRSCSLYFPNRVIPMLPPEISSGLASLVPGVDRLAIAMECILLPDGAVRRHRFFEAVIRSRAKLSYGGIARALGLSTRHAPESDAHARLPMLELLAKAAAARRSLRSERGPIRFPATGTRIEADASTGEPVAIHSDAADPGIREAYAIVEEMMLLTNELAAAHLEAHGRASLFRVHPAPDVARVAEFCEAAAALDLDVEADLFETPGKLAAFLAGLDESASELLGPLALRSMVQAAYSDENTRHYALATDSYTHFTSPIRRYSDLVVHRVLRSSLRGQRAAEDEESLRRASGTATALGRRAARIQREVADIYAVIFMQNRVGQEFSAVITAVGSSGLHCTLRDPSVEAFCPIEMLIADRFVFQRAARRLVGAETSRALAVGQTVRVRLEAALMRTRKLIVVPVDFTASQPASSGARPHDEGGQPSSARKEPI